MSNRLAQETSPYLLQHQNNPVDWYPWGEEALQLAIKENKPILLSVGYSACHWCHVMEHESFTNEETAKLMNDRFVNIKVDREERPDIDQIYQNVSIAISQSGGWPLTVFLTPDLKPFYGGTYFPPSDKFGRPGFPKVLVALSEAFKLDHKSVVDNANRLVEYIASAEKFLAQGKKLPTISDLQKWIEPMLQQVDLENGGIGGAPKFPNTMLVGFFWRFGSLASLPHARDAAILSLTKMAHGGIYDHLGGGFHRYSVDAAWSVPHFEKMLYDNALLMKLYAEVLLELHIESRGAPTVSPSEQEKELYLKVLQETSAYVRREMTSPEGGFYSAQDADSEGEEGKFFVWDHSDLVRLVATQQLSESEAKVFQMRYGITEEGNFDQGKTVLHFANSIDQIIAKTELPGHQVLLELASAKAKLLVMRNNRIKPSLDNKVLTGWNGLMISGMIWASQALRQNGKAEDADLAEAAAQKAFQFVCDQLVKTQGRLSSSFQMGKGKGNAYLDDYAFMAAAALDLSRFSKDSKRTQKYLQQCNEWISGILKHFKDSENPGYFFTSNDHESLIHRPKTVFDQAIPSGTAVSLGCMMALVEMDFEGSRAKYETEIDEQVSALYGAAERTTYGMGELLSVYLLKTVGPIVVSGAHAGALCLHPYVFQQPVMTPDQDKVVICHDKTCTLPMASPDRALDLIREILRF